MSTSKKLSPEVRERCCTHPESRRRWSGVNAGTVLSHHTHIGNFVTCGPNVAVASRTTVGDRTLLGVSACTRPQATIGNDCTVGAGAAVRESVTSHSTVVGNPAKLPTSDTEAHMMPQSDWSRNSIW